MLKHFPELTNIRLLIGSYLQFSVSNATGTIGILDISENLLLYLILQIAESNQQEIILQPFSTAVLLWKTMRILDVHRRDSAATSLACHCS